MPITPPPTVTYWAQSVFDSRTMLVNAGILLATLAALVAPFLALPEVAAAVPPRYALSFVALTAVVNLVLRTRTVRPVAFIPVGETAPVAVPRLDPPPPVGGA